MEPLHIVGAVGSPYSRKLLSVLRYRRLPHRWIQQGWPEAAVHPKPKVSIIPHLILDGEARTDSTPLIRELERRHPNERSVIPHDPAIAFSTRCSRTTPTSGSRKRCSTTAGPSNPTSRRPRRSSRAGSPHNSRTRRSRPPASNSAPVRSDASGSSARTPRRRASSSRATRASSLASRIICARTASSSVTGRAPQTSPPSGS